MNGNDLLAWLAHDLTLSSTELRKIASSAPFRYKHYRLAKRSGGFRDIYHPTPELKSIQKWITKNILGRLKIHDAVCSYRRGVSIRDNAETHLGSRYFLRLDFTDFFPSIRFADIAGFLAAADEIAYLELDASAVDLIGRFLCRAPKGHKLNKEELALTIGAPSSPAISNTILFALDEKLNSAANERGVKYTRYADDLYFSTVNPNVLAGLAEVARALVASQESPRLRINEEKTSFFSHKQRVQVTGLILKPQGGISVGRARKRYVKGQVHKFINGMLEVDEVSSLKGMLAFIRSAEPGFLDRLERKYGADEIAKLLD